MAQSSAGLRSLSFERSGPPVEFLVQRSNISVAQLIELLRLHKLFGRLCPELVCQPGNAVTVRHAVSPICAGRALVFARSRVGVEQTGSFALVPGHQVAVAVERDADVACGIL